MSVNKNKYDQKMNTYFYIGLNAKNENKISPDTYHDEVLILATRYKGSKLFELTNAIVSIIIYYPFFQ